MMSAAGDDGRQEQAYRNAGQPEHQRIQGGVVGGGQPEIQEDARAHDSACQRGREGALFARVCRSGRPLQAR